MTYQDQQRDANILGDDGDMILQYPPYEVPENPALAVKLRDVFNLLAQGKSTKSIRRMHPHIRRETVALARSFLIANKPSLYDQYVAKNQAGDLRMLVDECLPARIIPTIRKGFGYATHTNFAKLTSEKDNAVWQWAVDNQIDAIFTHDWREAHPDKDLTLIAKMHTINAMTSLYKKGQGLNALESQPVIVHIKSPKMHYHDVSELINRYNNGLLPLIENPMGPVVVVHEAGVHLDVSYQELWDIHKIYTTPAHQMPPASPSEIKWLKMILRAKSDLSPDETDNIMEIIRIAQRAESIKAQKNKPS